MAAPLNETQNSIDAVVKIFQEIEHRWQGCDWNTKYGARELNLNGLTAKRARLLSNATSGEESRAWAEASAWLTQIESAAVDANSLAKQALNLFRDHKHHEALKSIEAACEIESRYHCELIWQKLREIIERLASPER
jgi:hypothetical protein